jgi:hypothetical protein
MKTQNSIRFALLVATALFTHATWAAKAPPPPPPQPSSGTIVLDYDYPGGGASLHGLAVAPSGTIYSSGTGSGGNDYWHGIVLASYDSGSTWWNILDDTSLEWYTDFCGGIISDAFGNIYVAGILSDRWIVRRSTDGGQTWTTVDTLVTGSEYRETAAITTDAAGNVYVAGTSLAAGQTIWTVRKGVRQPDGGMSFSTVDQGTPAWADGPLGIFAHPTAGIFVAGLTKVTIRKDTIGLVWLVRRSTDGGATWSNVDTYQLSSLESSSAMGVCADASGNLYVVGSANVVSNGRNSSHWIVRKSTNGGNSWTTVDDYQLAAGMSSQATSIMSITTDALGDLFVAGYGAQADGTRKWIVRKSAGGTGPWTTVDVFQGSNFANLRIAIAADSLGNVFVGGDGYDWLIKKY